MNIFFYYNFKETINYPKYNLEKYMISRQLVNQLLLPLSEHYQQGALFCLDNNHG